MSDGSTTVHLAHHWWVHARGGGRVFEEIAGIFPDAGVSMLVIAPETLSPVMRRRSISTSVLQWIAPRWIDHRWLLALFPWAVRRMRIPRETRLLVSSDAAVIKGLPKPPGCVHVCYCHSPPRYLWDMVEEYARHTRGLRGPAGWLFRRAVVRVQSFDRGAASNVDHFIANSHYVAARIKKHYGRDSLVVYPPVHVNRFNPHACEPGDYYLVVSELVSYKRVDLAVAACSRLGRKLRVVGDGAELPRLRAMAGATVEFLGRLSDSEVAVLMEGCRAFLYPQIEDFGITAVEAQAAGRPVIALGQGGALETVIEGVTGCFFVDQEIDSLADAIVRLETNSQGITPANCRRNAERFSPGRFRREFEQVMTQIAASKTTHH
jgi:glycosyltransferase involved in cell wall biosynthesis